ncbi:hypothetical protein ABT104_21930 [Streptomyces mobaraensis]|uniref:hypothetical protein n=1 Tax=Streptomyces mobaraensis TaxID=35621 RepID=UPI003317E6D6
MKKHPPQKSSSTSADAPTPDDPAANDRTAETPATDTPAGEAARPAATWPWFAALAALALICWGFTAVTGFFEDLGGGPVRSAADYRTQDIRTRAAGKAVIAGLRPGDHDAPGRMRREGSSSCVDDLGFDGDGVTRDELHYTWDLEYAHEADYLADLDKVRATWRRHGWKVEETPESTEEVAGRRERHPPSISTVADHGITLSMYTDWFTKKPTVSANGGCVRYRTGRGVGARESSGAAKSGSPAREGTVTYADGVRVSVGPVRPIALSREETGGRAPAAHTYLVPVTVTNDSGAPVRLRLEDIERPEKANPGVRRLTGFPAGLDSGQPEEVSEDESRRLEFVYTAEKKPSRLDIRLAPGEFHHPHGWTLSVP